MAKPRKTNGRKRKTKDRGDEAEMRKGSLELQPVELKSDDFALHLRSTKAAVERMKSAKNLYDGCCKSAKKVSPQLLEAVKLAIKFEGKDMQEVKSALEVLGFVLKETDHPLQLTIHDTLLGDVNEAAYARGEKSGAAGMAMANPYPDGSDLAEQYATGWRNGQAKLLNLPLEESGIGHNSQTAEQQAAE